MRLENVLIPIFLQTENRLRRQLADGYGLCEVIAAHPYGESVTPLYGELYGHVCGARRVGIAAASPGDGPVALRFCSAARQPAG